MLFSDKNKLKSFFEGKTVAIVGSAPSCQMNAPGYIDSHDVVVRVNNYKLMGNTGRKTDVHYSFYGFSVKKTAGELQHDGVKLCMNKCPNSMPIESAWHQRMGRMAGVDFTQIYKRRKDFWFTDTYVPSDEDFLRSFELLGNRIPTTGFAAILDILTLDPAMIYLTGFDFFKTRIHNVDEHWQQRKSDDPIGHVPERERQWLIDNLQNYPIELDKALKNDLHV